MRSCWFGHESPFLRSARPLQTHRCSHLFNRRSPGLWCRHLQQRRGRRTRNCADGGSPDGLHTSEGWIAARRQRKDWTLGPRLELSREAAVLMQLQVRYVTGSNLAFLRDCAAEATS
jgi:hypothetical protein